MDKKLYDLMDWAEIEAVVYSEEDRPHDILGPHLTGEGLLIQAFIPLAVKVFVVTEAGKEIEMEKVDEEGYYAVLIPGKSIIAYHYLAEYADGSRHEWKDSYAFSCALNEKRLEKFCAGIAYDIYEDLGAHIKVIDGVSGVEFAVWAPNALRVSVVGGFNQWDGRMHQMRRIGETGVFEIFIPEIGSGEIYKYEIKAKGGLVYLKSDPYANFAELRPNTASVVYDIEQYQWKDEKWLKERKKTNLDIKPMSIYEVHIGSWKKPKEREFYNYREIAPMLAEYVLEMGYTHIELLPIMEHPLDASWGYQVTGYYAPTSRFGTPDDFMYFMDYMHEKGIGVILDWVPAHFPRDTFGLSNFDGTCLYEHRDPRQGAHPHWGTLIYNYGRPEVKNFLIANALYWVEKFHADGIRMDAVASMLYLDYGKNDGEWVANMYGGNENLEAIEFFKHLNSVFRKKKNGAVLIAEESTAWPNITKAPEEDGLGFHYKWNMGWMNDFLRYMEYDPYFRSYHHGELCFSMVYAYSEKFILVLSHDEVVHGKGSMIGKMPGKEIKDKFANLRVAYGFMMAHPGKKLLFMGQEFGQFDEWSEERSIEWEMLQYEHHADMQKYVKALNRLYREEPALYELDYEPKGFEWINNISANESIVVFLRKSRKKEDTLLIVCNFTPVVYKNYKIGVPYRGKYKEIFNSDEEKFGGEGNLNRRVKQSKKDECDDRPNSVRITVPPLGISVFKYSPAMDKSVDNKNAKGKMKDGKKVKAPVKKSKVQMELTKAIAEAEKGEEKKPEQKENILVSKKNASKKEKRK
jgi:1,4-alpha-glucan branching enzyme